jgi:hypothetical protein
MAAGTEAAVAAAIAQAVKASGSIVRVAPGDFSAILQRTPKPLVVRSVGWIFGTKYRYLTNYRGLTFYTSSGVELNLPGDVELIACEKIWVPN